MDDLLPEFVAETRETLQALSGEIVAWEADPSDRARLDAIFRFVHTVKGSCGFLDLPRLARLSHAAEDALAAVRDGRRPPDTRLVDAVLAVVDRIGELVEAIDGGVALDSSAEDLLVAALAGDAAPDPVPQPQSHLSAQAIAPRAPVRTVRLGVELLDRMMSHMSEVVLARNELARRLRDGPPDPRAEAALERLSATVADLRDTVTRTRMQRIEALFSALPRLVRDTAAQLGRAVHLEVEGADVELDREMIEMLRDPLVHIVRNAIDHGVEPPARRRALGKREAGALTVSARQSGNRILVEVSDDGAGIDAARLGEKAVAAGLVDAAALAAMGEAARLDLVFHPGLSSRDTATDVSGRGVGMDVVRANIEAIGGRVSLLNRPGLGLTVAAEVPLTLSILSTVVLESGGQRFAVARGSVDEIVTLRAGSVRVDRLGDATVLTLRGARLPLVDLRGLLGLEPESDENSAAGEVVVVLSTRDGAFALAVDAVLDAEELVVKPAAPAVMATGLYAGQTLPDTGRPMLLLDAGGLATRAGVRFGAAAPTAAAGPAEAAAAQPGLPALTFACADGRLRAVPLGVVDRVEQVPPGSLAQAGGRWHLLLDGRLVPLAIPGDPDGSPPAALRLTDGAAEVAYPIAAALDIVALPGYLAPAPGDPAVAGVAVVDGAPVEVLDLLSLFAAAPAPPAAERPVCLIQPDPSGWTDAFLRPVLEAAGYACRSRLGPGEAAAVALALDEVGGDPGPAPLVRLRRDPAGGPDTVWRYDRDGLLAAVAARVGGAR